MRPEETRIAVEARHAYDYEAYEAFSKQAAAEKQLELRATINRPLGITAMEHSSLDDMTLLAQSFVLPGFGIHPETGIADSSSEKAAFEPTERQFRLLAQKPLVEMVHIENTPDMTDKRLYSGYAATA